MKRIRLFWAVALLALSALACAEVSEVSELPRDPHSFSNPDAVRVDHMILDLEVDFGQRRILGSVEMRLERFDEAAPLILDTRDLTIHRVEAWGGSSTPAEVDFSLGEFQSFLGSPLEIELPRKAEWVKVVYATSPDAMALQWLEPSQTADGRAPFLFTQSQAVLARSWVPCQDSPGVRMTYQAGVRVPEGLLALMSASNPRTRNQTGEYEFEMSQPIPAYLLALAVGDLEFRSLGPRTGIYAEPSVIEKAAWEFAETEAMLESAEGLYGPYRWERYDMLVLPPSFPFGGMENPRLTFLTPTVLAGDRSLVSLIAHELAHSWSGNLVTNANWNDFWLNEGFTTYIEHRIMEEVYGPAYERMLAQLALRGLRSTIEEWGADDPDTRLHLDLSGRDPDEAMSDIAYEKGHFFLRTLERELGREVWDGFLKRYFRDFEFESVTAEAFLTYLLDDFGEKLDAAFVEEWVYGTGLPESCPEIDSEELALVGAAVEALAEGSPVEELNVEAWTTHHWLHFLRSLPRELPHPMLGRLQERFGFFDRNSEILHEWLLICIASRYEPALPVLREFLTEQGRRKFLQPLYQALSESGWGSEFAHQVYREARPLYHPISRETVDQILGVVKR